MQNFGEFFRLLGERIDANGGIIPDDLLQAVGLPNSKYNHSSKPVLKRKKLKRNALDERIDKIIREKFF